MRRLFFLTLLLLLPMSIVAQDTWKINLKKADLREFITQISNITGKTFIIDPRVKGEVTVISNTSMSTEAIYELFQSVLRVQGFAAVPAGNVVKIVQNVMAKQAANDSDFTDRDGEEIITRVIPVKNTEAPELVKLLRPLIPQYGHIAGLNEPNALIISDHADNIRRMIEIVNKIDVADTSEVEIVQLKEAWVEDMVALLEQLAPEHIGKSSKGPNRVTIVANERNNSLVLRGSPETIVKVKQLIDELDTPSNRSGSIQVVRLSNSNAKELADILKNLVSETEKEKQPGANIPVSIQADESLNALVIRADPTTMNELKDIIAKLDVRRLQVLIEAAIVEVTADFTNQLGTELAIGDASSSSLPLGLTAPSGTLAQILQSLALGTTPTNLTLGEAPLIAGGKQTSGGTSFGIIVRALSSNSDVNLLSTPSITTMDNEEAKIVVGQNVPFRTGSTVTGSQGANNPFTTISREDVGLTLEVTPHIHDGDVIQLEIHQEVSEVDQSSITSIGSAGSADLITNKRTIDTTVLADNEEVIILGGLIRDKVSEGNSRVPLLGDIPFLGRLFKSTTKTYEKQNLLVFLRPTVLGTKEAVQATTERKYTGVWEVEIEGRDTAEILSDLFDGKR